MKIVRESLIQETPRVLQVRGLFDLAPEATSRVEWDVDLPLKDKPWNMGLIVGPSGCGKSTIASQLFTLDDQGLVWAKDETILDAFPPQMPIKEITETLSSVGFSSPPCWLRPFHVLSTGQQFRVTLARLIANAIDDRTGNDQLAKLVGGKAEPVKPIIFDEYTSVVDRTVAQIASAALQKTVRRKGLQFVAVTCHEDVEPWLNPDWVYRPAEGSFLWRSLQRRPAIDIELFRCHPSAWSLFSPHHYLSAEIHTGATCFLARWRGQPVCFSSWITWYGAGPKTKREHRTVTLPDFQGVGIGNHVSATIARMWKALGYRASSTTTHPSMINARVRSSDWIMTRKPSMVGNSDKIKHASTRLTAGFLYIGEAMSALKAKALLGE